MLLKNLTSLPLEIRSPIAIEMSILTNFILHYHWTWKDRKGDTAKHLGVALLKFNLSSGIIALLFNFIPLLLFVALFNIHENIANILGILLAATINFTSYHFYTFKREKR